MERKRNFERIYLERVRKVTDHCVNDVHDELHEAYYKNWKLGKGFDFYGYNVLATLKDSKYLFDKLHGTLFLIHEVLLDRYNESLPKKEMYHQDKFNTIFDANGVKLGKKSDRALRMLKERADTFIRMRDILKLKADDEFLRKLIEKIG